MKNLFVAVFFALLLVGCDKSSPTAATDNSTSSSAVTAANDVAFSEYSMYVSAVTADSLDTLICNDSTAHDSLHHHFRDSLRHADDSLHHFRDSLHIVHMFSLLKDSLALTDAQVDSIQVYVQTLFAALDTIHAQVRDSVITRDEALVLVQTARDQFITSVESILTADQLALLDEWMIKFWNHEHQRGHRGGGEHGGMHGDDHGGMHGGGH
jgi:hypothetical protein